MKKGRQVKRLTFEFARGYLAHYEGKPFNEKEHPDWQDGWMSRQIHFRRPYKAAE